MNEQRPPTSPGAHGAGQPQRVSPAPHVPLATHAPQPVRPAQATTHAPQPLRPPQAQHAPTFQPAGPRPAPPARPIPAGSDDELVVLDDDDDDDAPLMLEDEAHVTPPRPTPVAAAPHATAAGAHANSGATKPVSLDSTPSTPSKKITFGAEMVHRQRDFKRVPHNSGTGPCRVRTFHAKLSDQGLEYLDDAINMFLDGHPEIDVKFVEQTIGMFDGKFKDFALIVSVWY